LKFFVFFLFLNWRRKILHCLEQFSVSSSVKNSPFYRCKLHCAVHCTRGIFVVLFCASVSVTTVRVRTVRYGEPRTSRTDPPRRKNFLEFPVPVRPEGKNSPHSTYPTARTIRPVVTLVSVDRVGWRWRNRRPGPDYQKKGRGTSRK
jgi:hypothetical protein